MTKLLPIIALSLLLAWIADQFSAKEISELGTAQYIRRNKLCFVIIAVAMAFFVGLRTSYNDTETYIHSYELITASRSAFADVSKSLGDNPLYNLLNIQLKIWGVSTQGFLMFYAFLTLGIYIWFLRKHTENMLITIFLFITMGCFTFTMAAIKQCVAVAFCLLATDRVMDKKYIRFVFWVLVAAGFHPYSLMYLIAPLLVFRPWSYWSYIMITIFIAAGLLLNRLVGTIVDITTMLGEEYDANSFVGEGVNIFRVLVVWVPVLLSFTVRNYYAVDENNNRSTNLVINFTTLNACIMFVGYFGTANYFARLANYFLIFQTLALPAVLKYYSLRSRKFLISAMIIGFSLYMYYQEALAYNSFDVAYKSVPFFSYISTIF